MASECRVGGMLSGKCGIVHVHVGPGSECLAPLFDVVNNSEIPISQFVPTHMDRSEALIADGARWLSEGGRLDITCRSVKCRIALKDYDAKGLLADNGELPTGWGFCVGAWEPSIASRVAASARQMVNLSLTLMADVPSPAVSVSSDAYGSLPVFDGEGNLIRYKSADAQAQLRLLRQMYFTEGWPLEKILPLMTSIPAGILKLQHKGRIEPGCDADILMLSATSLKLKRVIAKGKLMKAEGWVAGGVFEKGPGIRPYVPL